MKRPRVGIGVILLKDNKVLLGLRKSNLGKGDWGFPGGKLDFGEDPKDCAVRELKEETNLITTSEDLVLEGLANTVFDEETHYITLFYKTENFNGELKLMEPDKCERWEWFDIDKGMPENVFEPIHDLLKIKK